jgi:hypothetical protein
LEDVREVLGCAGVENAAVVGNLRECQSIDSSTDTAGDRNTDVEPLVPYAMRSVSFKSSTLR